MDTEWDRDLTNLVQQDGVLEWEWDLEGEGIGEWRVVELTGEAILLELGA